MLPIVCVVGKSNVGKTTFLEKLIAELTGRGWRVGTIKHDAHGFDIDKPGKDSWRHAQAGSRAVAISSPDKVALIRRVSREVTLDEMATLVAGEVDIVLSEGYKRSDKPKIEISRQAVAGELLCSAEELIALVSDRRHGLDVPQFGLDDAAGVADLLEERFLRRAEPDDVALLVDGRCVVLKPFARSMLDRTVRALLSLLDGCAEAKDVTLVLRNKGE